MNGEVDEPNQNIPISAIKVVLETQKSGKDPPWCVIVIQR